MTPIVSRPRLLASLNRMKLHRLGIRDAAMVGLALIVVGMIHSASLSLGLHLGEASEVKAVVHLFLIFFLWITFAASVVNVYQLLANSVDSQMLRAMPISVSSMFRGRFFDLVSSNMWLFLIVAFPFWSGLMLSQGGFYPYVGLALLCTFLTILTGAGLALAVTVTLLRFLSIQTLLRVLTTSFLLLLAYTVFNPPDVNQGNFLQWAEFTFIDERGWRPTAALAALCAAAINGEELRLLMLLEGFGLALLGAAIANAAYCTFENEVHEKTIGGKGIVTSRPSGLEELLLKALSFNHQLRAFVTKELRYMLRDASQVMHLVVVFGLAGFYISNFKKIRTVEFDNLFYNELLQVGLSTAVLGLTAFVLLAVAVRFSYPSVSLEGKSFELIKFMPLSTEGLVQKKVEASFVGLGVLSLLVSGLGCYCASLGFSLSLFVLVLGLIIAHGLASVSVGIGAMYAKFSWDSPSEVYASFGSLVCICVSASYISLMLIPSSMALFAVSVQTKHGAEIGLLLATTVVLGIYYLGRIVSKLTMRSGVAKLEQLST